jgi:hypothetical protein
LINEITIIGAKFSRRKLARIFKTTHELEPMSVDISKQQFDISSDAIIHLAGKARRLKSKPQDYYEANFEIDQTII